MFSEWEEIARYIRENYDGKVVEIGVGRTNDVAMLLKDYLDIIVTDIVPYDYELRFIQDDLFHPDMNIYKGANLIYSIRPPIDIQPYLASISSVVKSDLIIRPFKSEIARLDKYFKKHKLINYGRSRFYLYKNS